FQTSDSTWTKEETRSPRRVVGRYFDEGLWRSKNPDSVRGRVGDVHRMLSTYLNTPAASGLLLQRLLEPIATGEMARSRPGYTQVPAVLVARYLAGE
ncbi:MAG: class I SAM-dependent methyltransferase, partial [Dehalococcoidia bacterium]